MDRERNCYNCKKFGYLIKYCRSWKIMGQWKRIEYKNNLNNVYNLKVERK